MGMGAWMAKGVEALVGAREGGLLLDFGLGVSAGPAVTDFLCFFAGPEVSSFDPEDDSMGDGATIFSGVPPSMGEWSWPLLLAI